MPTLFHFTTGSLVVEPSCCLVMSGVVAPVISEPVEKRSGLTQTAFLTRAL
jgi:hypothetical protein